MVSFGVSPIWTLHLKFEKKYTSKLESQPLRLSYIPTLNVITYAVYLRCNTPRDKFKWFLAAILFYFTYPLSFH